MWGYRFPSPDLNNTTFADPRGEQSWQDIEPGQTVEFTVSKSGPLDTDDFFGKFIDEFFPKESTNPYKNLLSYVLKIQYSDRPNRKSYLAQFTVVSNPGVSKNDSLSPSAAPKLNWEKEESFSEK